MSLAEQVLAVNDDLPIRTHQPVHSGKVRSVYWLTEQDSRRLIKEKGYPVAEDAPLAIMVISDRISAFDCIWHAEGGVHGVPGKGARSMLSRIIGSNCSSNMVWRKVIFSTFLTLLCGLYKKPVLSKLKPSAVNTLLAQCGVLTPKVSASFVVLPYQKV